MPAIPRDPSLDSTLALLLEGYAFIPKRCERFQSDIFETRLLFERYICLQGAEAATIFYDTQRFQRQGATPARFKKTVFGRGGVQGLDGEAHRWRKHMFMSLMVPAQISQLVDTATTYWDAAITRWETAGDLVLLYEVREVLCRAVCAWAGVPLAESEVQQRTDDLAAMVDSAGATGPRHWQGLWARQRAMKWSMALVEQVRAQTLHAPEGSALQTIATHRDVQGKLLDTQIAATELLNVLRPIVAIDRFVVFAALALHEHPDCREHIVAGDDRDLELFVQEVRRFYPFFPFVVARVRTAFEWQGYHFPQGCRVLLDLYGTNHDSRLWEQPYVFRPERFQHWQSNAYTFIPQGGGDHYHNHRCAGEWITIDMMKMAVRMLTKAMEYDVPPQDMRVALSRIPAIPNSRLKITNVRRCSEIA